MNNKNYSLVLLELNSGCNNICRQDHSPTQRTTACDSHGH